jgi:hypothetical protein
MFVGVMVERGRFSDQESQDGLAGQDLLARG